MFKEIALNANIPIKITDTGSDNFIKWLKHIGFRELTIEEFLNLAKLPLTMLDNFGWNYFVIKI